MTIEEISKKIECLNLEVEELMREREKQLIGKGEYVRKYIYCRCYGYMYVTEEFLDYKAREVIMCGFSFNYSISPYADDFWFSSDACKEWRLPLNRLNDLIKKGDLKEVTKEEFFSAFENAKDIYDKESITMLNKLFERHDD